MDQDPLQTKADKNVRLATQSAKWIGVIVTIMLGSLYLLWLTSLVGHDKRFIDVLQTHFLAVAGAPCAALVAFVLVVILEQVAGPIELEAGRLKFKGASGPVILWLLVFMTLVFAASYMWTVDQ